MNNRLSNRILLPLRLGMGKIRMVSRDINKPRLLPEPLAMANSQDIRFLRHMENRRLIKVLHLMDNQRQPSISLLPNKLDGNEVELLCK
jgi:hypothetical protein